MMQMKVLFQFPAVTRMYEITCHLCFLCEDFLVDCVM